MAGKYNETTYEFSGIEELEKTVSDMEDTFHARKVKPNKGGAVLCKVDESEAENIVESEFGSSETVNIEGDVWRKDHDRAPNIIFRDGSPVNASAVSKKDRYYTTIQFHEPLSALAKAVQNHDDELAVSGEVTVCRFNKRLTANIQFSNCTVQDPTGNTVELGMRISTAHNGFNAVKVDVGAERVVCTNGLVSWDSEFEYTHEHNEGDFNPSMMEHAVEAVVGNSAKVRERFENLHEKTLGGKDEMFLILLDSDIQWLFDDAMEALQTAFEKEATWHENPRKMRNNPSLYDAFMVGTYAIDHLSKDGMSEEALNAARDRLTNLLENYDGEIPEPDMLLENTVNERTDALMNGKEERWDGERELVRSVASSM